MASAMKSEMYPLRIWWDPDQPPIVLPDDTLALIYCQMSEVPTHKTLTYLSVEED